MKAILAYVEKLTVRLNEMAESDLAPLRGADLSDEDILDVVMITSYFGHMNRIVSGLGVKLMPEQEERQAEHLPAREGTPA